VVLKSKDMEGGGSLERIKRANQASESSERIKRANQASESSERIKRANQASESSERIKRRVAKAKGVRVLLFVFWK
jgi:uncharacterized caspase-like protein